MSDDEERMGTMLGPDRLQELVLEGIEGQVDHRDVVVERVLHELMFAGNALDVLAFIVGCLFCIREHMPKGATAVLAVTRRKPDGSIEVVEVDPSRAGTPGEVLFTEMLVDYVNGRSDSIMWRFIDADTITVAQAVGVAVRTAANIVRSARASLQ